MSTTVPGESAPARAPLPMRQPPRSRRRRLSRFGAYVAATLLALWVLLPLVLITFVTFVPRERVRDFPKSLWPEEWSADTFMFFINSAGVRPALLNSVVIALMTVVMAMAIGAPGGYALARFVFRGANAYRITVLSTRAFPIVILSIPLAITFLIWGIADTRLAVALMHTALALPFVVLITSSIFLSVSKDLEEAAQTLGCTAFQAFYRVSLPLTLPGLTAAAIFTFVLSWNEVFAAVILTLRNPTLPALVLDALTVSPLPFQFAAGFVLMAPSLIFLFFIRKYLLGLWGRVER
ncbi:carbohydrate ABC transporter permease [Egicoccus sp. AB-alg6-2]|uniref:carbohydrate ABC transporter permease n=1 Tax=Egicoccus sp. AB-alg6-2 TaxID=3242692 RepID=UPI00359E42F6